MSTGALPGFRDFYPAELAERSHIMRAWREVARRFGFVEYDGPPLEPLELYTKKSGDEIVGQLYNFTDKGGRDVALRPEMTPTFARMVSARANALRKPVRWFSVPQLFRYERQQRGRLREHFQLNVDIVGETDVTADAELLAVAVEIMRELGLGVEDVRARVSDRRLLSAILAALGVAADRVAAVFAVVDKLERQPEAVSEERLREAGMAREATARLLSLVRASDLDALARDFASSAEVMARIAELRRYLAHLDALGVAEWVKVDLTIVRGLAYYTGIVFELFDARGELRAICGGGRYDTLLAALGGADLPALGFGMGDVVLGELLRDRALLAPAPAELDYWVVPAEGVAQDLVLRVATALRRRGYGAEYVLNTARLTTQKSRAQMQTATKAGAHRVLLVRGPDAAEIVDVRHEGRRELNLPMLLDPTQWDAAREVVPGADPLRYCSATSPT